MEKFDFYVDRKCTVWEREFFSISADTKDDAIKEVISTIENGDEFNDNYVEEILEIIEYLSPIQNKGFSTVEVYENNENGNLIWENGK